MNLQFTEFRLWFVLLIKNSLVCIVLTWVTGIGEHDEAEVKEQNKDPDPHCTWPNTTGTMRWRRRTRTQILIVLDLTQQEQWGEGAGQGPRSSLYRPRHNRNNGVKEQDKDPEPHCTGLYTAGIMRWRSSALWTMKRQHVLLDQGDSLGLLQQHSVRHPGPGGGHHEGSVLKPTVLLAAQNIYISVTDVGHPGPGVGIINLLYF